jgi:hypothetical protein
MYHIQVQSTAFQLQSIIFSSRISINIFFVPEVSKDNLSVSSKRTTKLFHSLITGTKAKPASTHHETTLSHFTTPGLENDSKILLKSES